MTENQTAQDVIYLVSCAVNERIPDKARIASMDREAVFALAARHMIRSAVAFALESAGCSDKQSGSTIAAAQWKTVIFQKTLEDIKKELEEAGIWYMPLKGAVLKDLYPKYSMREFVDHDILFDASRAEDVKAIMEGLGFTSWRFGVNNHDCYYKNPCLNFEMHRTLFDPNQEEKLYTYYQHVEDQLLGDGCEKHFSPEDFYVYFLAHEYKHYYRGGTGLRSLLDTYVYLSKIRLDINDVEAKTEKLGIREFEEQYRALSLHLYGGEALTAFDREMLDYILSSGANGSIIHSVQNKMRKNGWGKFRYMLNRFSVPISKKNPYYTIYAGVYPFFYQHKVLLPLLPFYRTFLAIRAGRFKAEAKAVKNA